MTARKKKYQMTFETTADSVEDLMWAIDLCQITPGRATIIENEGHLIGSGVIPGGAYAFSILEVSPPRKERSSGKGTDPAKED